MCLFGVTLFSILRQIYVYVHGRFRDHKMIISHMTMMCTQKSLIIEFIL